MFADCQYSTATKWIWLCVVASVASATPATAQQLRAWRDRAGAYEVRARLMRIDNEEATVRLQLEDGSEIVVPSGQ